MCGIFGLVVDPASGLTVGQLSKAIRALVLSSESRGKDASGVLAVTDDELLIAKMPERGRRLLKTEEFARVLAAAAAAYERGRPFVIAGHTRMVTHGTSGDPCNNQPVVRGDVAVLHNGIIVNVSELWASMPGQAPLAQVDTEALVALIEQRAAAGAPWPDAAEAAFASCVGANTVAVFDAAEATAIVMTSNGSCFHWRSADGALMMFASEAVTIEAASGSLSQRIEPEHIEQLRPGQQLRLDVQQSAESLRRRLRVINVSSSVAMRGLQANPSPDVVESIRSRMTIDFEAIDALRRCTRCVLPETFPYLTFDADGVCSSCLGYEPQEHEPIPEIGAHVAEMVARGRSNQVLVPISGGRDSCFGLHYVVRELGLDAVAYTYDWGYVTDRARRNISRMCGELGVEHILVAADLRRKRENVRKNIQAWSARPNLGMIPLFMAGDKAFFKFASDIRNERNLATTIFSMNRLEPAGFKTGFAGVDDRSSHDKTYGLKWTNTARLASYYAIELLTNPRYVNSSVPDSLGGFSAYYLKKADYVQLFDHLTWDEETVNRTIIDGYGWETSPESNSTWRVGDGTAPFYNFAYLAAAGFTEHDTFRSNQIREGMLDRSTALRLVNEENQPQPRDFIAYCETTGIDPRFVIAAVRRIPRLY